MKKGYSLGPTFNKAILALRENGFLDTAYKTWWFDKGACLSAGEDAGSSTTKITIDSFGGILIMLLIFIVISTFFLIFENIYFLFYSAIGHRLKPFTMIHRFFGGGHVAMKSSADNAVSFVMKKKKGKARGSSTIQSTNQQNPGQDEEAEVEEVEVENQQQASLDKPTVKYRRSSRMKGLTAYPVDSDYETKPVPPKTKKVARLSSAKRKNEENKNDEFVDSTNRIEELNSIQMEELGVNDVLDVINQTEKETIPTVEIDPVENPTIEIEDNKN